MTFISYVATGIRIKIFFGVKCLMDGEVRSGNEAG